MTFPRDRLVGVPMPPLLHTRPSPSVRPVLMPRQFGRLAGVLAALALPVLGLVHATALPRAEGPGTAQAAAPPVPPGGAAAAQHSRPPDLRRTVSAALTP